MLVRTRGGLTRLTYRHHPFDVVGWDGCLYPYAFNIADFEPIVKRTHAPPPVHQTFEGPNFVICSFCPRPLDFHPEAVPIPYNHHNVDSDEMMFYVGGDYTARKGSGIDVGLDLAAPGRVHPRPAARRGRGGHRGGRQGHTQTSEMAVMVDTFRPLDLGPAGAVGGGPRLRLDVGPVTGANPTGPGSTTDTTADTGVDTKTGTSTEPDRTRSTGTATDTVGWLLRPRSTTPGCSPLPPFRWPRPWSGTGPTWPGTTRCSPIAFSARPAAWRNSVPT